MVLLFAKPAGPSAPVVQSEGIQRVQNLREPQDLAKSSTFAPDINRCSLRRKHSRHPSDVQNIPTTASTSPSNPAHSPSEPDESNQKLNGSESASSGVSIAAKLKRTWSVRSSSGFEWQLATRFGSLRRPKKSETVRVKSTSSKVATTSGESGQNVNTLRIESIFSTPTLPRKPQNNSVGLHKTPAAPKPRDEKPMEIAIAKNMRNAVANAARSTKATTSTGANVDDAQLNFNLKRQRSMCCDDSSIMDHSARERQLDRKKSNNYELSDDFIQCQIKILEQKYGGSVRARKAAIVIQRAYRRYCLERQFRNIRKFRRHGTDSNQASKRLLANEKWQALAAAGEIVPTSSKPKHSVDHGVSEHSKHVLDQASHSNYERMQDLIKDRSKVVYQISDSNIYVDQPRPPFTARGNSNRSSGNSTNRLRSKSTERCDRRHHISAQHRVPIKILSDRADVLGASARPRNSNLTKACAQPYRDDPYAPRLNLAGLQTPNPDTTTISLENLDKRTSDGKYINMSGAHSAAGADSNSTSNHQKMSPIWKRNVESPKVVQLDRSPKRAPSPKKVIPEGLSPMPSKRQNTHRNSTPSLDSNSTTLSASTPGAEFANCALIQSPVDSNCDIVPRSSAGLECQQLQHSQNTTPYDHSLFYGKRTRRNYNHVKPTEAELKRRYRIGLNFFNKKPDRGVDLLINLGFVEPTPEAVSRFLLTRKGLSRQMIGEYLGSLQQPFNMAVLRCFAKDIDLHGLELDAALRKFQSFFRLPGEAQKIERIVQVFADRYCELNPETASKFRTQDTLFVLAFAIIMLNTDLHSPNLKPERRMKLTEFIKNLKGIDDGADVDPELLTGIYQRVKASEFRPGHDHVAQVIKVDRNLVGKKPQLSVPHRRLVCYCRLYEVLDPHKKQSSTAHQREIFLFNDIVLITKILHKRKSGVTYSYRECHSLVGMQAHPFKTNYYDNGIRIAHTLENKVILFNARNEEDRVKFLEDLRESILESDEMEALRIELSMEKQKFCMLSCGPSSHGQSPQNSLASRGTENRDSGLADEDSMNMPHTSDVHNPNVAANGRAVTSSVARVSADVTSPGGSLVNLRSANHEAARRRRNSINSLDSGMSSTASTASRDSSPTVPNAPVQVGVPSIPVPITNNGQSDQTEEPTTPKFRSDAGSGAQGFGFAVGSLFGHRKGSAQSPASNTGNPSGKKKTSTTSLTTEER